jgi:hypothetical protein
MVDMIVGKATQSHLAKNLWSESETLNESSRDQKRVSQAGNGGLPGNGHTTM